MAPEERAADRVTPECVRAYVEELRAQVKPVTVRGRILDLLVAVKAMAPGCDVRVLEKIERRLHAVAVPSRDKDQRLHLSEALLNLGLSLIEEANPAAWWWAPRFRDGLMIAFLAARPLRLRSFQLLVPG